MAAVDYTHTPDLPENVFGADDSIVMEIDGGTLTLVFDGAGGGDWSFEDASDTVTSGSITEYGSPQDSRLFGIPDSGFFTSPPEYSYARSLAAREVLVFFDGPVGPHEITAIQPQLSFHTGTSGWYNGPANADGDLPAPFRGTFDRVAAP